MSNEWVERIDQVIEDLESTFEDDSFSNLYTQESFSWEDNQNEAIHCFESQIQNFLSQTDPEAKNDTTGKFRENSLQAARIAFKANTNPYQYYLSFENDIQQATNSLHDIFSGSGGCIDVDSSLNLESFDTEEFTQHQRQTVVFNLLACRQSYFAEKFFPTKVIGDKSTNIEVTVVDQHVLDHEQYGYDHTQYSATAKANPQSLVKAFRDPQILSSSTIELIPHLKDSGADDDLFTLDRFVPSRTIMRRAREYEIKPLQPGKRINLFGISKTDKDTFDNTDEIAIGASLSNLYLGFEDGGSSYCIRFKTDHLSFNQFKTSHEGESTSWSLNFSASALVVNDNSDFINESKPQPLKDHVFYHERTVLVSVNVYADLNYHTGDLELFASDVKLERVLTSNSREMDLETEAQTVVQAFYDLNPRIVGYDPRARRTNSNWRDIGSIIDTSSSTESFAIEPGYPLTIMRPTNEDLSGKDLFALINASRMRSSNNAVTTLINYAEQLHQHQQHVNAGHYSDIIGPAKGIINPYYEFDEVDVRNEIFIFSNHMLYTAAARVCVDAIRSIAYRMLHESDYAGALELLGGSGEKPKVIIGCDPRVGQFLNIEGQHGGLLGDHMDYEVVTTNDSRMSNRVFLVFSRDLPGSDDSLSFGVHGYIPEIIEETIDSSNSNFLRTQIRPRSAHMPIVPILGELRLKNLQELQRVDVPDLGDNEDILTSIYEHMQDIETNLKTYTDDEIDKLWDETVLPKINQTKQEVKTYTDNELNDHAIKTGNTHGVPNGEVIWWRSAIKDYADQQASEAENNAKTYTDTRVDNAKNTLYNYVDNELETHETSEGDVHGVPAGEKVEWRTQAQGRVDSHAYQVGNTHGVPVGEEIAWKSYSEDYTDQQVSNHANKTGDTHGVPNGEVIEYESQAQGRVDTHSDLTGNIHGIPVGEDAEWQTQAQGRVNTHSNKLGDTHGVPAGEEVEWQSQAQSKADTAESNAKGYTDTELNDHNVRNGVHGLANGEYLESISGAQAKADTAEENAKTYTDVHEDSTGDVHGVPTGELVEWQSQAQSKADTAESNANAYTDTEITNHENKPDPHNQYQLRSEKGQPLGYVPLNNDGEIPDEFISESSQNNVVEVADIAERDALLLEDWLLESDLIRVDDATSDPDIEQGFAWYTYKDGGFIRLTRDPLVRSVNGYIGDVSLDYTDVDADQAGSAATAESNAKTYTDNELSTHSSKSGDVHGVPPGESVEWQSQAQGRVSDHSAYTDGVHGVPLGEDVEWQSSAQTKADTAESNANTYTDNELQTHNNSTNNVHGVPTGEAVEWQTQAQGRVDTHASKVGNTHGIPNGEEFASKTYVNNALDNFSEVEDHAAKTGDTHGVPAGSQIEWKSSAQAKADQALADAKTYIENYDFDTVTYGAIRAPNLYAPDGVVGSKVPVNPELMGGPYNSLYSNDLRTYRRFEVVKLGDGEVTGVDTSTIDWSTLYDELEENSDSGILNLELNATFAARILDHNENGVTSEYSDVVVFTTVEYILTQPVNNVPADGEIGVYETPTLEAGTFSVEDSGGNIQTGVDTHVDSEWSVEDTSTNEIVIRARYSNNDYGSLVNLTSFTLPRGILEDGQSQYRWYVRYKGQTYGWSKPSTPYTLTTVESFFYIYVGGANNQVYRLRSEDLSVVSTSNALTNAIAAISYHPDHGLYVGHGNLVSKLDSVSLDILSTSNGLGENINDIDTHPQGSVFVAGNGESLYRLDGESLDLVGENLLGSGDLVRHQLVLNTGSNYLSTGEFQSSEWYQEPGGGVTIIDYQLLNFVAENYTNPDETTWAAVQNTRYGYVTDVTGTISRVDQLSGTRAQTSPATYNTANRINILAADPLADYMIVLDNNGIIHKLDEKTLAEINSYNLTGGVPSCVKSEENYLYITDEDGNLFVVDSEDLTQVNSTTIGTGLVAVEKQTT